MTKVYQSAFATRYKKHEFEKHVHGKNNHQIIRYFFGKNYSEQEADESVEEKEKIYRSLCLEDKEGLHLAAGVADYLDHLVNTNTAMNLDFYFQIFGLSQLFDCEKIIYNDGNLKSKPDLDAYIKASQILELELSDCVVFEDSVSGIHAANNASSEKSSLFQQMQITACLAPLRESLRSLMISMMKRCLKFSHKCRKIVNTMFHTLISVLAYA